MVIIMKPGTKQARHPDPGASSWRRRTEPRGGHHQRRGMHHSGPGGGHHRAWTWTRSPLTPTWSGSCVWPEPYKKANRKFHPEDTVVDVCGSARSAAGSFAVIAGPCSVESRGADYRGGPGREGGRGRPPAGRRLQAPHLPLLLPGHGVPRAWTCCWRPRRPPGCPSSPRSWSPTTCDAVRGEGGRDPGGRAEHAELRPAQGAGQDQQAHPAQAGPGQHLSRSGSCPPSTSWPSGNENVILCERGIRTFETVHPQHPGLWPPFPPSSSMSHLPVIVDPSHAAGMCWMVEPLAMAAIAVGADGLIIEVHNDPPHALCDGQQSLTPEKFARA